MTNEAEAELARAKAALEAAERRHAADREREAMLRTELRHRMRNTLALVRSIFTRSVAAGSTVEDLASHFPGRLDVLARHQLSYAHGRAGPPDLETMVRDELQSIHSGADPRIVIAGPEVRLADGPAQALALALHELATNSIKFGALGADDPRDRVHIEWRVDGEGLHFRWKEMGVAVLGPAPPRSGFGREFIEQALPYQLGAETSFELRPGGLCCAIVLPLAALHAGSGAN